MDLSYIKSIDEFDKEIGLSEEAKYVWVNMPTNFKAMANAIFLDNEWENEDAVNRFVAYGISDMFGFDIL